MGTGAVFGVSLALISVSNCTPTQSTCGTVQSVWDTLPSLRLGTQLHDIAA